MDETLQGSRGFKGALAVWSGGKWLEILVFAGTFLGVISIVMFPPNIRQSTEMVLIEGQQVTREVVCPVVIRAAETRLQVNKREVSINLWRKAEVVICKHAEQ